MCEWHGGTVMLSRVSDLQFIGCGLSWALLCSSLRHVVHILVFLSARSIPQ